VRFVALAALGLLGAATVESTVSSSLWARNTSLACPLRTNATCNGTQTGTFVRATAASYIDDSGVLQSVSSGVERYSPTRGHLIEGARTNRLTYSRDGTNAAWTKSNVTAALTGTGKDGVVNSATLVTATAGNGTIIESLSGLSSTARVGSVYVRRITGTGTVNITCDNGSTWTAIVPPAAFATTVGEADRFVCTKTASTTLDFGLRLVTSGDAVVFDLAQAEEDSNGSGRPTSPIVTTSAEVARNQDRPSFVITGVPDIGVFEAVVTPNWAGSTTFSVIADTRNSGTTRGMALYVESAEKLEGLTTSASGGTDTATSATLTWAEGTAYHVEFDYGVTPKVYRDHVLAGTASGSGVGAVGQTVFVLGRAYENSFPLNGWIRDVRWRAQAAMP
jgi:hypothetical protein